MSRKAAGVGGEISLDEDDEAPDDMMQAALLDLRGSSHRYIVSA
jgi:hypothetical protein